MADKEIKETIRYYYRAMPFGAGYRGYLYHWSTTGSHEIQVWLGPWQEDSNSAIRDVEEHVSQNLFNLYSNAMPGYVTP